MFDCTQEREKSASLGPIVPDIYGCIGSRWWWWWFYMGTRDGNHRRRELTLKCVGSQQPGLQPPSVGCLMCSVGGYKA